MMRKLRKRVLAFFACLMAVFISALAEGEHSALVVWNGEKELYSFYVSDNPVLKISNGNALVQSDGEWEQKLYFDTVKNRCYYEIPMSETSNYKITIEKRSYTGPWGSNAETGIGQVSSESVRPAFSLKDGLLRVGGLKEGESLIVSTTDGKLLGSVEVSKKGYASLSLQNARGTIVVKAGEITFKILVK